MLIAGIISEYNPFHMGHARLIRKTREAGATHIAAVLSGNFVQRGEPAILSKTARTRQALLGGADLVVELPAPWAVAGAESFARGGVFLLDALGASWISFGSECGNAEKLNQLAELLLSPYLKAGLREGLRGGVTFATARQQAVKQVAGPEASAILAHPNNILGIEYCKAALELRSNLIPFTICREGPPHDAQEETQGLSSALRIRSLLRSGKNFEACMPQEAAAIIKKEIEEGRAPASLELAERAVMARLRTMKKEEFALLPDISEGLENRVYAAVRAACSLPELYAAIKTKRYPLARIRRILLSAFLGITAESTAAPPPYLRILGLNQRGAEILHTTKMTTKLPILVNTSDSFSLDRRGRNMFELEGTCYDLFSLCMPNPIPCGADKTAGVVKL